jgi:hypothetical protein
MGRVELSTRGELTAFILSGLDIQREGCWKWKTATGRWGYGLFTHEKVQILVHRFVWELVNGPVPPGMCVLHRCDNPPCARPDHLFLGTKKDNSRDMAAKGRGRGGGIGERNHGAKLTSDQVLSIRALWSTGAHSQKEIGEKFGLTQAQVSNIVLRRHWKHLVEGVPFRYRVKRGS